MKRFAVWIVLALSAAVTTGCLPFDPGPPAPVVVVPTSIDATGATDVWAPFTEFLASVPNGSTIKFRPGRYRMEQTLIIENRDHLNFDGAGATIFATTTGTRGRSHIEVLNSQNIVFRGLRVTGAHPNGGVDGDYVAELEAQHGFELKSAVNVVLDSVTVSDVYGDFVWMGKDEERTWTTNVLVQNSTFARNGRMGIAMTAVRNVLIQYNSFNDMRRSTFDLEAHDPGFGMEQITIRNNDIGASRLLLVASVGHGSRDDFTFEGNRVARTLDIQMHSADGEVHRNWKILNNTATARAGNPSLTVMKFDHVDGLEVRGNYQKVDSYRAMVGARVGDACNVEIDGNTYPTHDPYDEHVGFAPQGVISGTC